MVSRAAHTNQKNTQVPPPPPVRTVDQCTLSVVSFLCPIYFLISYFRLFLSLSFLFFSPCLFFLVLSFPLSFICFSLPFFLVVVFLFPVCLVFLLWVILFSFQYFYFFTRMYSYVTLMLLLCTRMWLVCYPFDSRKITTKLMNSHQKTQE